VTLTGYGSFYLNDNFYVDARISVARPDFDQSREIDFTLGSTHIQRTAVGKTNANQYSVAMSAGYHFNKNSWNITPNASFRYVRTNIDGFTETGAGAFNFVYSDQELESLVWSAGIRMSKAISLKNGVITPQFDFDYNYESKNDGNNIEARFIMAPDDEFFTIETDTPDRTYGSAGLGFVYITSNGKQAYINYRSVLGLEGFSRGTFNFGARFEF
jgi:outer membrane lipase/esterase